MSNAQKFTDADKVAALTVQLDLFRARAEAAEAAERYSRDAVRSAVEAENAAVARAEAAEKKLVEMVDLLAAGTNMTLRAESRASRLEAALRWMLAGHSCPMINCDICDQARAVLAGEEAK